MDQSPIIADIFSQVIQQGHQAYFIFDLQETKFVFTNDAFRRILDLPSRQASIDPLWLVNIIHPDDKKHVTDTYRQIISGEKKEEVEVKIINPEGIDKWLIVNPYLIKGVKGQKFIAGTAQDISEKKQYIDNLQKFAAKKNSVLEILSHDLAGPLNLLQSLAGILAVKVKPYGNPDLDKTITIMVDACKRNVKLIREFVANEFLESSEVALNKQRIDIVERLRQVMNEYKNAEDSIAKNFEFTYSSEPLYMEVDDTKFLQVINNLLSNAIKFTPDNGTIRLEVEEKGKTVLFTLSDNGIGIPAEWQPVLFDKFSKARRPGLRGEESTGLGMSIIKSLVTWHGGNIWFKSEENKGSTFYIELPKE
jgi:two-component system sensor histidine kinase VicK